MTFEELLRAVEVDIVFGPGFTAARLICGSSTNS